MFHSILQKGWVIASRNINIQVKDHVLGYAWNLIIPLFYAFFYVLVKQELTSGSSSEMTIDWDVVRAFSGILLFQCWMQTLQDSASMVRRQKGLFTGLNIRHEPFVVAIIIEGFINLMIRVLLIVLAVAIIGLELPDNLIAWCWFVLSFLCIQLSAVAIGLLISPWAILYPDVQKGLRAVNLPIILISPIFYHAVTNSDSILFYVNIINPLASPLAVMMSSFQDDGWPFYGEVLLVWFFLSFAIIIWSTRNLRVNIPILLERMG